MRYDYDQVVAWLQGDIDATASDVSHWQIAAWTVPVVVGEVSTRRWVTAYGHLWSWVHDDEPCPATKVSGWVQEVSAGTTNPDLARFLTAPAPTVAFFYRASCLSGLLGWGEQAHNRFSHPAAGTFTSTNNQGA